MNMLSWLLYAAHVSDKLSSSFYTISGLSLGLSVVCLAYYVISKFLVMPNASVDAGYNSFSTDQFNRLVSSTSLAGKAWAWSITAFIIFGALGSILPDRKTVTLIAASEIGEKVVSSDKVQNVFDPALETLKTWMEKETMTMKAEIEKSKNSISK